MSSAKSLLVPTDFCHKTLSSKSKSFSGLIYFYVGFTFQTSYIHLLFYLWLLYDLLIAKMYNMRKWVS